MNDEHELNDDAGTEEFLAPLRKLAPLAEGRGANRAAVTRELAQLENNARAPREPWWRRRVSLPLPVAVAMAAMLLVSLTWTVMQESRPPQPQTPSRPVPSSPSASPVQLASAAPRSATLEYSQTNTYVLGVGVISSESRYLLPE